MKTDEVGNLMKELEESGLCGSRLTINLDGVFIFSASFTKKTPRPNNHEELVALFKQVLECMEAPEIPADEREKL